MKKCTLRLIPINAFKKCKKFNEKKYPQVKKDLEGIFSELEKRGPFGDSIPGWGRKVWKVEFVNSDLKRGSKDGYRLIYFVEDKEIEVTIYPLIFYCKKIQSDVSSYEIEKVIKELKETLGPQEELPLIEK